MARHDPDCSGDSAENREAVNSGSGSTEPATSHSTGAISATSQTGSQHFLPPLSASWRHEPLSQFERDKVHMILRACGDRDIDVLRELASSEGGLIEDEVRRAAWPILLNSDHDQKTANVDWTSLPAHRDEDQVQLDVNRSFVYYPKDEPEQRKTARKDELSALITSILRQHPLLHYFQGYHDIVQVLLLVLGVSAAMPACASLSVLHIRDFMLPTMAGTEPHLRLFKDIVYAVDPLLAQHLRQTEPFFALAATLTLYAHEIEEYGDIARLFDFLLANEASMSLYLYAAIVISRKDELLEMEADEPEMLFHILSKLPKPLNLESLIRRASEISSLYPPERLPGRAWRRISAYSVLKTTHGAPQPLAKQSLTDGERMFKKQAAEFKRAEAWNRQILHTRKLAQKYKRPATYTATAVFVGVVALLLRRGGFGFSSGAWMPLLLNLRRRTTDTLMTLLGPPLRYLLGPPPE